MKSVNHIIYKEYGLLLSLIRVSLGFSERVETSSDVNWTRVMNMSIMHGVYAIVFDAFEKLPNECRPNKDVLIQWAGQCLLLEKQGEKQWDVANKLALLFRKKCIDLTIIKGRAIAQYYPNPQHRYSCDLDLFIEEGWDDACSLLEEKGIILEREVYKEVEFNINNVYVECHRYITPLRGHKTLRQFEIYLRSLLHIEKKSFEDSNLICPPLMFSAMLFIEHALGDFLQGKLFLKHVIDWVILRRQNINWEEFDNRIKEFKFHKFYQLINNLADVVEGKLKIESIPSSAQQIFMEIFSIKTKANMEHSWFKKRMSVFFNIIINNKRFRKYGYCSMYSFLFNSLYTHFFKKEVKLNYN